MDTSTVNPSIQRRITWTLFIVQSLFGAAQFVTFTLTSIVAARLSGLESLAGIPATLVLGGRSFIGYPVGWVMDRYGRRPGFVLGYALGAIGAVICVFAILHLSFWQFCLGSLFLGMGRGISEQTRYAAAEVYPQSRRAFIIGILIWAGTIGSILGSRVVGPSTGLAAAYGLDKQAGPYLASIGMALVAMVITYLFLRPDPRDVGQQLSPAHIRNAAGPARSLYEIFASRQLQLAVAAMVIGQLVMTLIMVITPLHMTHEHHGLDAISWVQLAHTMGMFGLAFVTGWLIDRFGQVSMIVLGGLILVVSSLLTPVSNSPWVLALALFLLGLGWNFCFTAGSSLMANGVESHERGRAQGFSETLVALASGLGSLGTGPAFAYGGIITVSAIGLICTLIFLAITFWLAQQHTAPQPVSE